MKAKCRRCKHEWDYTGKKEKLLDRFPQYVVCPRCYTSVKLNKEDKQNGRR